MFNGLQNLSKAKRNEKEFNLKMEIAKKHIKFCLELYKMQMEGGRYFLHEKSKQRNVVDNERSEGAC